MFAVRFTHAVVLILTPWDESLSALVATPPVVLGPDTALATALISVPGLVQQMAATMDCRQRPAVFNLKQVKE